MKYFIYKSLIIFFLANITIVITVFPIYDRVDKISNYLHRILVLTDKVNNIIESGKLEISDEKKNKIKNIISEIKNDILTK
jgi:hypothetical protein